MRFTAATLLLAAFTAAQQPSDSAPSTDLIATAGPSTLASSNSPSNAPTPVISTDSATVSSTTSAANSDAPITGASTSGSAGSAGASTTITGEIPSTTDWSALGCTQFATISGTLSPLCVLQQTTDETSVWATQSSQSSGDVTTAPISSTHSSMSSSSNTPSSHMPVPTIGSSIHGNVSSHHEPSSTPLVPITPTEPPHSDLLTTSKTTVSLSTSRASVPAPVPFSIWLNSTTFETSTKSSSSFGPFQNTTKSTMPHTKSSHHSSSHTASLPSSHGPQSAGGYTMTKSLTETVRSTTTIPAAHSSAKQTVVTTVVLTTSVSTVTAEQPISSPCVDKTITSTTTLTKFVTKPAESSQSLVMISQLSDGQINGPPVTTHGPLDPSSLDFLHSTTKPTPTPSAFIDPLQSWLATGHPQPYMGFPHHGPYSNSTTCTESKTKHNGTETRNPDAPIPFPTQSFYNFTSLLEHGHGPKPGHQPTLSA